MIRAILACDEKWGIGKNGTLPWPNNSADLKWFKESTTGGVVVMGRKTWDSLPFKPLPNRKNIVVSSSLVEGADITVDVDRLTRVTLPMLQPISDIWIIGGAKLFESTIDIMDEIWLSNIAGEYDCDTFLPKWKIMRQFTIGNTTFMKNGPLITKWVRR